MHRLLSGSFKQLNEQEGLVLYVIHISDDHAENDRCHFLIFEAEFGQRVDYILPFDHDIRKFTNAVLSDLIFHELKLLLSLW